MGDTVSIMLHFSEVAFLMLSQIPLAPLHNMSHQHNLPVCVYIMCVYVCVFFCFVWFGFCILCSYVLMPQMGTRAPSTSTPSTSADTQSASTKPLFPSTAQVRSSVTGEFVKLQLHTTPPQHVAHTL